MHIFRHFFRVKMHIFHETNIAINSGNIVFCLQRMYQTEKRPIKNIDFGE